MPDDSSLVVTQDWNIEDYGWSFLGNDRTPGEYPSYLTEMTVH